jgi:hypothetical protein
VPNVLTADVLRKLRIPTDSFNASFKEMMKAGLDRLLALQRPSGGWGWFDRDAEDPFMTACAVRGLSECARLGYAVDAVALKRGRERLRAMAKEEQDLNRLAYEVFALGEDFDRVLAARAELSPYAQALLALALHQAGRPEAAEAARSLAACAKGDHWETPNWYYKWDNVAIETTAYAVQALLAIEPGHPLIPKAVEWLLAQRQGNRWRSTKDTAVAIATLLQVAGLEKLAGAVAVEPAADANRTALLRKVGVVLNGGERREILVDLNNPLKSGFEAHFSRLNAGPNQAAFERIDEQADLRFDLELHQQVFRDRVDAEARGLDVRVEYDRPPASWRLGDEVAVKVTVQASEEADYVMVLSPIPAGGEVIRGSGQGEFARFEARYEKAIFFLRKVTDQPVELAYKMRCSFAGSYTILPPWAGIMYNEEVYGTGPVTPAVIRP